MTRTSSEDTGSGRTAAGPPALSFILATDTYETIRPVVECLRRQTVKHLVEVVLVAPSATAVSRALDHGDEFAAMQIVEADSIDSLGPARASGVRAATSAIVYIAETHAYPAPQLAEALIAAHSHQWDAVAPSLENANPTGVLSWAGFLADYGQWIKWPSAREIPDVPPHNASFRRSMLLEMGDGLPAAFSFGNDLMLWIRARGYRCYFEPSARTTHANITRLKPWVRARFVFGILIGSHRRGHWSLSRRLAYVCGAPLIPAVLVWRVLPAVWRTARQVRLPVATVPLMVLGACIQAAGELIGYAGGPTARAQREMHEYEVHRVAYFAEGQQ